MHKNVNSAVTIRTSDSLNDIQQSTLQCLYFYISVFYDGYKLQHVATVSVDKYLFAN
jgi:hypothetical protein